MQTIKSTSKFSIYWRSIFTIVLIALVFSLQSCGAHNKHGAATPDRIVEQYLLALADRNETSILRLMPENSIADSPQQRLNKREITAKIARFGGHKVQDRQIKYTKTKPTLWNANVQGFYVDTAGSRRQFNDSIEIEYQSKNQVKLYGGRWYLLLEN